MKLTIPSLKRRVCTATLTCARCHRTQAFELTQEQTGATGFSVAAIRAGVQAGWSPAIPGLGVYCPRCWKQPL